MDQQHLSYLQNLSIKSLKDFIVDEYTWTGYKLSPHELLLFKNLPVSCIDLEALDLTQENAPVFQLVFREMKVKDDSLVDWMKNNYGE